MKASKVILLAFSAIIAAFTVGFASSGKADASLDAFGIVQGPTVDGKETLARMDLRDGGVIYLTAATGECDQGWLYGLFQRAEESNWFCWRADVNYGTIDSTDKASLNIEDFAWTLSGRRWLRAQVRL